MQSLKASFTCERRRNEDCKMTSTPSVPEIDADNSAIAPMLREKRPVDASKKPADPKVEASSGWSDAKTAARPKT